MLDTTDALSRINLAIGNITENEFKSYFSDGNGNTFDSAFGSIDEYFQSRQKRGFDRFVYDHMSDVQRFFNGLGYTAGEILSSPLDLLEGLIDGVAYVATGFGAIKAVND